MIQGGEQLMLQRVISHPEQRRAEEFSVTFKDGSCLDIKSEGAKDNMASACLKLFEQYLREHPDQLTEAGAQEGAAGTPSNAAGDETLLSLATCADCGEPAFGELMLPSGFSLPFCFECTVKRMQQTDRGDML